MSYAAIAGVVLGAVAGYFSYTGTRMQYKGQENQAKAAAKASEVDALLHQKAGEAELAKGQEIAKRQTAMIRGAGGATGTEVGSGSLLEVELESARLGEYNAQLGAYQHRLATTQSQYRTALAKNDARNIRHVGRYVAFTNAMSTFLSSASGSIGSGMAGSGGGNYQSTGWYNGQRLG